MLAGNRLTMQEYPEEPTNSSSNNNNRVHCQHETGRERRRRRRRGCLPVFVILFGPLDESLEIANNENGTLECNVLVVHVFEQFLPVFGHACLPARLSSLVSGLRASRRPLRAKARSQIDHLNELIGRCFFFLRLLSSSSSSRLFHFCFCFRLNLNSEQIWRKLLSLVHFSSLPRRPISEQAITLSVVVVDLCVSYLRVRARSLQDQQPKTTNEPLKSISVRPKSIRLPERLARQPALSAIARAGQRETTEATSGR